MVLLESEVPYVESIVRRQRRDHADRGLAPDIICYDAGGYGVELQWRCEDGSRLSVGASAAVYADADGHGARECFEHRWSGDELVSTRLVRAQA